MRVDFTPQVGFVKHNTTGPAGWRKHQQPNAPALPTDLANGWPHLGWNGRRLRSTVALPFYAQLGLKKWGGIGELKPGHDSVVAEGDTEHAPVGVQVNKGRTRGSYRSVFTMPPASRGGTIMPMPTASGAYGVETSHPPTIIPSNPALDHGIIGLGEAPDCPAPETTAAKNARVAAGKAAPAKAAATRVASRPKGPGETVRKMFQRPSRSGREPIIFRSGPYTKVIQR